MEPDNRIMVMNYSTEHLLPNLRYFNRGSLHQVQLVLQQAWRVTGMKDNVPCSTIEWRDIPIEPTPAK